MNWFRIHPEYGNPLVEGQLSFTQVYACKTLAPLFVRHFTRHDTERVVCEMLGDQPHGFDLGGVMQSGRKAYDFAVDGIILCIPAIDLGLIHSMLLKRKPEKVLGVRFYGMNGFLRNVALLPMQRTLLLEQMRSVLAEADAIATIENDAFNRQLVDGVPAHLALRRRPVGKIEEG